MMEVDKVAEYLEKFVESALPVAKKAYDISLMTLQMDALAALVPAFLAFVVGCSFLYYGFVVHSKNRSRNRYSDPAMEIGFAVILSSPFLIGSLIVLLNIWNWVKLFAPELWLAHQILEKVVK